MGAFIGRRLLVALPTFFGASLALFVLLYVLPGDPVGFVLGDSAGPEQRAELRAQMGLDHPVLQQYVQWLLRLVRGDLGNSLVNGLPVAQLVAQRLPVAAELTLGASLIGLILGVAAGTYSGLRPRTALSRGIDLFNGFAVAVPVFWLGLLLQIGIAVQLGWLPTSGYVAFTVSPWNNLRSLVLPSLTLGIGTAAVLARFVAAGIEDTRSKEFILASKARGLAPGRIVLRHLMRNALIPAVTALGLQFGRLIGGAVLTEAVFNLPGLGTLLWTALTQRDYFVIQAVTLLAVVSFLVVNLLVDVFYGIIDPRVRSGVR